MIKSVVKKLQAVQYREEESTQDIRQIIFRTEWMLTEYWKGGECLKQATEGLALVVPLKDGDWVIVSGTDVWVLSPAQFEEQYREI